MTDAAVDKWLRNLNAIAKRLEEDASSLHPSAWPEALKNDIERWKKLAREGPRKETA